MIYRHLEFIAALAQERHFGRPAGRAGCPQSMLPLAVADGGGHGCPFSRTSTKHGGLDHGELSCPAPAQDHVPHHRAKIARRHIVEIY